MKKENGFIGTVAVVVLGIILVGLLMSIRTVGAGHVYVVTRWGKVTGKVLDPGFHMIIPIADSTIRFNTKKVIYETTSAEKQKGSSADYKDYPVDTNTRDGQQVDIFYTVRFNIDPTKAAWVAQNIGNEGSLVEKIVKTESRVWARNVPREYSATQLYTGNVTEIQVAIEDTLRPVFADNGLILDAVGIREIKFADDYIEAIEAKQIEAVNIETAQNRAETAKYEKEAAITQAEAQASAQELQRATISDQLLKKMWIERWDGNLPSTILGDQASSLIQLP